MAEGGGTFLDLGDRGGEGLAHFARRDLREPPLVRLERFRDPFEQIGALVIGG